MTKTSGYLLLAGGSVLLLIGGGWLTVTTVSGATEIGGAVLGFGLLIACLCGPLIGGGIYLVVKGRQEQDDQKSAQDMRQILDMVKTRGQLQIEDIIIELQSERQYVQDLVYRLVGLGLFDGYVNWDEGRLYSEAASELHNLTNCRNCNGEITIAGKGIYKCPYCGVEYFTSR